MRQQLSAIYEREQNWRDAANILVGIPLETAQKYVHSTQYTVRVRYLTLRECLCVSVCLYVCLCLPVSDVDSTRVITNWRHISRWLVSTWRTRTLYRPRLTSTERHCCRPSQHVKTCRYITRHVDLDPLTLALSLIHI